MGKIKLCSNDSLLDTLKDTFKANPISVPEERIKPLVVFSIANGKNSFIGDISTLLKTGDILTLQTAVSTMANVSGTKTKSIDTKTGLQIMDGFLKGLGANAASLKAAFASVTKVSFAFENVERLYIEPGELFKQLSTKCFDRENSINKRFIDEDAQCIVVDSVINSNNFTINVEESSSTDFAFDLPEIQGILSSQGNSVSVKSSGSKEISFEGVKMLAFAFSASKIHVNDDGTVYYDGESDKMNLTKVPGSDEILIPIPIILDDEFALNEISFD